ncbi:hypothetical protein LJC21_00265 [Bacteroides sp. OttesenSCG-928-E20]|nr:hypothetical protein [Bacteroides sp. OttesenSCG-928-E20]MDL2306051.1 hypothetical protein [Bacteroides sp. OttesenSCG-928-D19]
MKKLLSILSVLYLSSGFCMGQIAVENSNRELPDTLKHRDNIIVVGGCTKNNARCTVTVGTMTQGNNWSRCLINFGKTIALVKQRVIQ